MVSVLETLSAYGPAACKIPPPKEFHASWEEWDSYRARYLKGIRTGTIVKESESAIKRNRQLQRRKTLVELLPECMRVWKRRSLADSDP
ncbi:hypothetical protein C6341_g24123 [Phytophthora cactorum]|nr:hypothetical protein C6341_g24123 [Phytophthora cactorum]